MSTHTNTGDNMDNGNIYAWAHDTANSNLMDRLFNILLLNGPAGDHGPTLLGSYLHPSIQLHLDMLQARSLVRLTTTTDGQGTRHYAEITCEGFQAIFCDDQYHLELSAPCRDLVSKCMFRLPRRGK